MGSGVAAAGAARREGRRREGGAAAEAGRLAWALAQWGAAPERPRGAAPRPAARPPAAAPRRRRGDPPASCGDAASAQTHTAPAASFTGYARTHDRGLAQAVASALASTDWGMRVQRPSGAKRQPARAGGGPVGGYAARCGKAGVRRAGLGACPAARHRMQPQAPDAAGAWNAAVGLEGRAGRGHRLIHSFIHSFIHPFLHSLIHSLIH
jgi:hypothetical protein